MPRPLTRPMLTPVNVLPHILGKYVLITPLLMDRRGGATYESRILFGKSQFILRQRNSLLFCDANWFRVKHRPIIAILDLRGGD